MSVTARYYPDDQDALTVPFYDQPLTVEADGDIVRIETGPPARDDQPWGSAGVSIEIPVEEAVRVGMSIIRAADDQVAGDIEGALFLIADDYAERANHERKIGDPGHEAVEFDAAAARYRASRERITP